MCRSSSRRGRPHQTSGIEESWLHRIRALVWVLTLVVTLRSHQLKWQELSAMKMSRKKSILARNLEIHFTWIWPKCPAKITATHSMPKDPRARHFSYRPWAKVAREHLKLIAPLGATTSPIIDWKCWSKDSLIIARTSDKSWKIIHKRKNAKEVSTWKMCLPSKWSHPVQIEWRGPTSTSTWRMRNRASSRAFQISKFSSATLMLMMILATMAKIQKVQRGFQILARHWKYKRVR